MKTRAYILLLIIVVQLFSLFNYASYTVHASYVANTIGFNIIPSTPSSMEPVLVLVEYPYNDNLYLSTDIAINIDFELEYSTNIVKSTGSKSLTINVIRGNTLIPHAYVVVYNVLGDIVASGFTDSSGRIVFNVNPGNYIVKALYDVDKDGLYEEFGLSNVKVGLLFSTKATVYLKGIGRVLEETLGIITRHNVVETIPLLRIGSRLYITSIPGLPSRKYSIRAPRPLPQGTLYVNIYSKASLTLMDSYGNIIDQMEYTVSRLKLRENRKPLVLMFVNDTLEDNELWFETLGLSPKDWSISEDRRLVVNVVVVDDENISSVGFNVSVNSGEWVSKPLHNHPYMDKLRILKNTIEKLLDNLTSILGSLNIQVDYKPGIGLGVYQATLRLPKGSYVLYYAYAIDNKGSLSRSLIGLVHVYTSKPRHRILIVDPHVKLWILKFNGRELLDQIKSSIDYYRIPQLLYAENWGHYENITRTIEAIINYGFTPFHYWGYMLGEYYEFRIVWPDENLTSILEEYKPDIIVLSNLYLGVNGSDLLDWDLKDLDVLSDLIEYVQEKHAGLIVTHGTLSDLYVWYNTGKYYKIGSRGHVGSKLEDIGILTDSLVEEKTISAMVGLRWIPLFEYIRDQVAYYVCKLGDNLMETNPVVGTMVKAVGLAIGSTPLQVPWVPWNGTLDPTNDTFIEGWSILDEPVIIPNPYQELSSKYKAYTQIGWQLGSPKIAFNVMFNELKKTKPVIVEFYENLSKLLNNTISVEIAKIGEYINRTIGYGLSDLVKTYEQMNITDNTITISPIVPEVKDKQWIKEMLKLNITLTDRVRNMLLQYYPVKILALSPDYLAGVIGYDKFWDKEKGYRAIYFSFEVEACITHTCTYLLEQAINWTASWRYVDILELLENIIPIEKKKAEIIDKISKELNATEILSHATILPSNSTLKLNASIEEGQPILIVYTPIDIEDIEVKPKPIEVEEIVKGVYKLVLGEVRSGTLHLELRTRGSKTIIQPILVKLVEKITKKPSISNIVRIRVLDNENIELYFNATRLLRQGLREVVINKTILGDLLPTNITLKTTATLRNIRINISLKEYKGLEDRLKKSLNIKNIIEDINTSIILKLYKGTRTPGQIAMTIKNNIPRTDQVILPIAWDLEPSGTFFDRPVTITIIYPEKYVKNINETNIRIAYYDDEKGTWVPLKTIVYPDQNKAIANISHFTLYTLITTPQEQATKTTIQTTTTTTTTTTATKTVTKTETIKKTRAVTLITTITTTKTLIGETTTTKQLTITAMKTITKTYTTTTLEAFTKTITVIQKTLSYKMLAAFIVVAVAVSLIVAVMRRKQYSGHSNI